VKNNLISILDEVIELLEKCDWNEKAEWFRLKRERINSLDIKSTEIQNELAELDKIIAGIGSFSDLPLYPRKGDSRTKEEIAQIQWTLAERLGKAIDKILTVK